MLLLLLLEQVLQLELLPLWQVPSLQGAKLAEELWKLWLQRPPRLEARPWLSLEGLVPVQSLLRL